MATKYPQHVAKLFKPGPPIEYKRPVDYPIECRKTITNISGVSRYLEEFKNYQQEFPQGLENGHLRAYDEADQERQAENKKLRAKLDEWKPQEDANMTETDPYKTIFVGRLPYSVTEVELQKLFVRFGEIDRVRVVRNRINNKSRGYGFVAFKNEHSARTACREIGVHRGEEVEGRSIIVDIERGRTVRYFTPRRLGGGLGGRGYMKRDRMARLALATTTTASMTNSSNGSREPREEVTLRASGFPRITNPAPHRSRFSGHTGTTGTTGTNANTNYSPPQPPHREMGPPATGYRSRSSRTGSRFER
ncbi:LAFA_0B06986g1_1 [Lachancea sp. 'fantastica']|nr:LAFA_0B06986g1_1 [Lachancea sp. 'fantastica']